jgi:hypothetical protein|tara:strand:+ start:4296 stop:4466 length:171 start_codon:yes stop_codon:yes gene_type:complete
MDEWWVQFPSDEVYLDPDEENALIHCVFHRYWKGIPPETLFAPASFWKWLVDHAGA